MEHEVRELGSQTKAVMNIEEKTDMTGHRFGRLIVLKDAMKRKHRGVIWQCLCDCGNITDVTRNALVSNRTLSCGCFAADTRRFLNYHQTGPNNPNYNPNAQRPRFNGKPKLRSTIIAEEILGRPLKTKPLGHGDGEIVHHINHDPCDNRHCNLLICTQSYHVGIHNKLR